MHRIATLGPKDTFSDLAAQQYIKTQISSFTTHYYKTLSDTFLAIGQECDLGILPIENLSEGYLHVVLDKLLDTDLVAIAELMLPIQFAFIADCENDSEVTDLFVQFVTHGQCSEFINQFENIIIHNTQSNIESLVLAQKKGSGASAIIPMHALNRVEKKKLIHENVTNCKNNQTRFLVLGQLPQVRLKKEHYKTTLIVKNEDDRPGLLSSIVNVFSQEKINLTSIVSRPTKSQFGKYNFFIDIDGHQEDLDVNRALQKIKNQHSLNIIGSYLKAMVTDPPI
ncbi:MAG: ACT domain-containing protein [Psychromonas sp.]|nr:ACT domain-containing protein [Psychromonas sp.]